MPSNGLKKKTHFIRLNPRNSLFDKKIEKYKIRFYMFKPLCQHIFYGGLIVGGFEPLTFGYSQKHIKSMTYRQVH